MTDPFQARIARDLVVVEGPDATSFLQSLVSQDLDAVAVGTGGHALLLQPQGKLLVDFYAAHVETDAWWCVCEGGFGDALASGLSRFKIRVKADVRQVPVAALAIRGMQPEVAPDVQLVAVDWAGALAFDAVGSETAIAALSDRVDVPLLADAYERARIEAGVPRQGFDTDERTIPQEAGLELVAVSFTKGCFVGQELVCRIDTRGRVNRHLRRLRAPAGSPAEGATGSPAEGAAGSPAEGAAGSPAEGAAGSPAEGATGNMARGVAVVFEGREVGEVTSAAGPVALAMLRREVEPGVQVTAGAVEAVVEAL